MSRFSTELNLRINKYLVEAGAESFFRETDVETGFLEFLEGQPCEVLEKIITMYFLFFLSYPSREEQSRLRYLAIRFDLKRMWNELSSHGVYSAQRQQSLGFDWVWANPAELYIDVTHTHQYPRNTGVQRVVRSICADVDSGVDKRYFAFRNHILRPVELDGLRANHVPGDKLFVQGKNDGNIFLKRFFVNFSIRLIRFPFVLAEIIFPWSVGYLVGDTNKGTRLKNTTFQFFKTLNSWVTRKTEPFYQFLTRVLGLRSAFLAPHGREKVLFFGGTGRAILLPEIRFDEYVEFYVACKTPLNFKLSLVAYDFIPLLCPKFCMENLRLGFLNYLEIFKVVDRVSSISQYVDKQVRAFVRMAGQSLENGSFAVHLPGFDFSRHTVGPGGDTNLETAIPMFLVVGTLEPRKNLLNIVRAALVARDQGLEFRLLFVGAKTWDFPEFYALVASAKGEGLKVECLYHVDDEELVDLYQSATATVLASFAEGYGLPIVESFAYGKPCIVSARGSMKEVASQGPAIFVEPKRIESIAAGFKTALNFEKTAVQINVSTWTDYATGVLNFVTSMQSEKSTIDYDSHNRPPLS